MFCNGSFFGEVSELQIAPCGSITISRAKGAAGMNPRHPINDVEQLKVIMKEMRVVTFDHL